MNIPGDKAATVSNVIAVNNEVFIPATRILYVRVEAGTDINIALTNGVVITLTFLNTDDTTSALNIMLHAISIPDVMSKNIVASSFTIQTPVSGGGSS